jgi:hypothetical protein
MIGFTDEHRQRFRIRLDEGAVRSDPYGQFIPGRFGDVYVHGDGVLGVSTHNSRGVVPQLRVLPYVQVVEDASDGINATFPAEHLKNVDRIVKLRRRKRLSPEQRAVLAERCGILGASRSSNASDEKNDQSINPAGSIASPSVARIINPVQSERGFRQREQTTTSAIRLARSADRSGDVAERGRSLGSNRRDRDKANNDDERQHHSVFDCGGAVFRIQKSTDFKGEPAHGEYLIREES